MEVAEGDPVGNPAVGNLGGEVAVKFQCPCCDRWFVISGNEPSCLLGGHYTPQSHKDYPPEGTKCCHRYQTEVLESSTIAS